MMQLLEPARKRSLISLRKILMIRLDIAIEYTRNCLNIRSSKLMALETKISRSMIVSSDRTVNSFWMTFLATSMDCSWIFIIQGSRRPDWSEVELQKLVWGWKMLGLINIWSLILSVILVIADSVRFTFYWRCHNILLARFWSNTRNRMILFKSRSLRLERLAS